ncbi:uncharacterized protein LOC131522474 [Onychostoma macrolepis]|uniref:uncharacterized protein LOC131522474 n=1 Tax=Onychostoma macrolepis TaxID=369639 RepID=UPI00272D1B22|nr:uncharacterized protein LOC131522474 [Onychostoma macrolepis]
MTDDKEEKLAFEHRIMMAGRGRGALLATPDRGFQFMGPEYASTGRGGLLRLSVDARPDVGCSPITKSGNPEYTKHDSGLPSDMSNLVRQIGSEIGEAIRDSLLQTRHSSLSPSGCLGESSNVSDTKMSNATIIDASKLNLILKSEITAPPYYRGDGTDKCSMMEWEELMRVYLNKKEVVNSERVEEVTNRLMGRARDIIKVWLSNRMVTPTVDAVFTVLRHHFSDSSSSGMPLADFYSVRPYSNESPLDYWIRLNKAAEVAEQGLREEGRTLENRSRELAVMFIRHCPDKELSLVFKSKPTQSWTASEVQERLDEMLREQKATKRVVCQQTAKVLEPIDDSTPLSHRSETATPATDNGALDKVLTMLEKALVCNAQSMRGGWSKNPNRQSRECRVCTSKDHSTTAHCKMYNLCFKCFSSGHMSFNCEKTVPRETTGRRGDDEPQGN